MASSGLPMALLETPMASPEIGKDGGVPPDAIFGAGLSSAQSLSCFRQTSSVAI